MTESSFLNPHKALLAAKVHEGLVVADFGAGSGFFTRATAAMVGEEGVVWAVDVNRELLPRIKTLAVAEGLHNVEVVQGDVGTVGGSNLPEAHCDLVIVANVLFALEHKGECVAEVKRVLKRGGRALVVDWAGSFGGLGPHKDHVVGAHAARGLFESQGFTYVEEVPAGLYHWGFVVRKKS
ncbi:MAG: methyltransferase domain-containing protein [Patescibacteria group bacterium]|nr:methyltransferase domain-containing protein [Patescibacteria group bacterium]